MKKSSFVFALIFILSGAEVRAQEIKVFAGGGWASYNTPPNPIFFEVTYTYHTHPGALAGIALDLPFSSVLSAEIGLQYVRKGTKDNMYYLAQLDALETFTLDVISLPLSVKLKPLPKLPAYVLGGGEAAYVLDHAYRFSPVNAPSVNFPALAHTRRFDFGLVAGGGMEVAAAKRFAVFAEARYYVGLVNLAKALSTGLGPYDRKLKTRFLALQAGLKYSFHK
jgi:opacity protein-like surface antigen